MATQRYWNANYWHTNYWGGEYWAQASGGERTGQIAVTPNLVAGPGTAGKYWSSNYWNANYWSSDWWKDNDGGTTFFGTFAPAGGNTGTIGVTLENAPTAFVGTVGQVVLFDLEIGFTVQWQTFEYDTYTGSIGVTLENATSSITGLFTADVLGSIATTLEDGSANFDGTHVAPASRSGIVDGDVDDVIASAVGVFIGDGGAIGAIAATLQNATANIDGQYITSNTDGTLADTLEDFSSNIDGVFAGADYVIGPIEVTLDDGSATFSGTHVPNLIPFRRSNRRNSARRRNKTITKK